MWATRGPVPPRSRRAPGTHAARRAAHRCGLLRRDVVVKANIHCTSVARTILDVADDLVLRGVERVVDQAEVQRLLDIRAMEDVLARANGRRGAANVRDVLAINDEPALTKSEMEEL